MTVRIVGEPQLCLVNRVERTRGADRGVEEDQRGARNPERHPATRPGRAGFAAPAASASPGRMSHLHFRIAPVFTLLIARAAASASFRARNSADVPLGPRGASGRPHAPTNAAATVGAQSGFQPRSPFRLITLTPPVASL